MTTFTRRIVIYRLGSLGDTVVALPCFHHIARCFPDAERIVLTNYPVARNAPALLTVLSGSNLVHRAIEYPVGMRSLGDILRLRSKLRQLRAETLIYLQAPRGYGAVIRDLVFFRFCGFTKIIGAPTTRDLSTNRADPQTGRLEPEYNRLARTLSALGGIDVNDPAAWDLRLSEAEKREGQKFLEPIHRTPFIAINMGGKVRQKDWGAENWSALISRVGAKSPKLALVILGAADDSLRASIVAAHWPGPYLDCCGQLSPRQAAAVLVNARLFVGHDSGPLHLAASLGVRCVGIFSNYNKLGKWYPWGTGHRILHSSNGIDAITVDQVFEAVTNACMV